MPGIPDDKIDEVRAASDLVDVVSEHVRLKKAGSRFKGLCPFHKENTPSFSVDPKQNLYYCFGCRRGGDVFKFIQEVEAVGFLDAVRLLADRANIELPEAGVSSETADRRDAMHSALRFAANFYHEQLQAERGKRALTYMEKRGFTKKTMRAFGIGYAPGGWDALLTAATQAGHKPEVLRDVGLVKERERGEGYYDVFRDRVVFPILSPVGKVLGFGGRILPDTDQGGADYTPAKYINTPETEVYHKSDVLYGLKQAKTAIRGAEEAILVEGYADVVSLYQAGVKTAVAASGTALTEEQVRTLGNYAQRILLLYDADEAGRNAAQRSVEVVIEGGLAPYVATLPKGADPDSFVQQFGAEAFREMLRKERQDFVTFLVARARRQGRLDTPEGKSEVAREVMDVLSRMTDQIARDEYVVQAAERLGVPEASLWRLHADGKAASRPRRTPEPPPEDEKPPAEVVAMRPEEAVLIRLMLQHGEIMVEHVLLRMGFDEFTAGPPREIVQRLADQYEEGAVDAEAFARGEHGGDIARLAAEVQAERHALSENWERRVGIEAPSLDGDPFEAAKSAMRLLKLDRVQEAMEEAKRKVGLAEQRGEDPTAIYREISTLMTTRRQIESGAFMQWGEDDPAE